VFDAAKDRPLTDRHSFVDRINAHDYIIDPATGDTKIAGP
jgi:hypothetical protein